MPQYVDDEVPMFGCRKRKDLKLYHTRKISVGPNLISKYIWYRGSSSDYGEYFDYPDETQLGMKPNKPAFPSLIAAQKLLLNRFNMPYSVNKQRRWTMLPTARKSIASFQDPSIGLRTCFMNRVRQHGRKYEDLSYMASYTDSSERVTEFHAVDARGEVHVRTSPMPFDDLFTPKLITPVKKKRHYKPCQFKWFKEIDFKKVKFEQKPCFVVFKVQDRTTSVRSVNMDKQANPTQVEECRRRNPSLSGRAFRKNQHKENKTRHLLKKRPLSYWERGRWLVPTRCGRVQARGKRKQQLCTDCLSMDETPLSIKPQYSSTAYQQPMELFWDEDGNDTQTDTHSFTTWQAPLCDFEVRKLAKSRNVPKKKKASRTVEFEYNDWFHSSPSADLSSIPDVAPSPNEALETIHEPLEISLLPSFVVSLGGETEQRSETKATENNGKMPITLEELMPQRVIVPGIRPEAFMSSIHDITDQLRELSSELDQCSSGYVFAVSCAQQGSTDSVRFIVNNDDNLTGEEQPESTHVPHSFHSRTPLSRFIPVDRFTASTSYAQDVAEDIAYREILAETETECGNLPCSPVDSSYCVICDSDASDGFALQCSHYFCRECWTSHATHAIASGNAPLTCPSYECGQLLRVEHALLLLPVRLCTRYKRMLTNRCMLKSSWLHCDSCAKTLAVSPPSSTRYLAKCDCGAAMCMSCKRLAHPSLSCEQARQYVSLIESNGQLGDMVDEDRWVAVKRCPFCGSFCERSDGCNHMECMCGKEFCYVCGRKWEGSSHYDCDADVSVRVNLFDVGSVDTARYSLNTLNECINYRRFRSSSSLLRIGKSLRCVLNKDFDKIQRVLSLIAAMSVVLELNAMAVYLHRREMRRSKSQRSAIKYGTLRVFDDRLSFSMRRLTTCCEKPPQTASMIHSSCDMVERVLIAYMTEMYV